MSKEIQQIIEKLNSLGADDKAILATVVDVEGSGYRRPGARMLIDRNGQPIGTVSGGCLEADVLERAKKVFETGEAIVITYDTTTDENSVFGLGMGCRGIVKILLETVSQDSSIFKYFANWHKKRVPFSVATLIKSENSSSIGRHLYFLERGVDLDECDDEERYAILSEVERACEGRPPKDEIFAFGNVFLETFKPPLELKLFGAGFDAVPLVRFAKEIGWRVSVVDHRPAFANRERLPEADDIFNVNLQDLDERFFDDENSVAVVMTHNYERDRQILPRLLRTNFQYVGALGPRTRTEKILAESGENFSDAELEKLHAPVGLDIGADTPEAIALSIVAEINAVLKNRAGGFLRERKGSIYGRNEK